MLELLVAGPFNAPSEDAAGLREFVACLAMEIVAEGHTLLNGCLDECELARNVVALAEQIAAPRDVAVLMSYEPDPALAGAYQAICEVCNLAGMRHNVYYEFGHAEGLRKQVVPCAHEGTTLPFDVHDHPTVFWTGLTQFRNDLSDRIKPSAREHGRG